MGLSPLPEMSLYSSLQRGDAKQVAHRETETAPAPFQVPPPSAGERQRVHGVCGGVAQDCFCGQSGH